MIISGSLKYLFLQIILELFIDLPYMYVFNDLLKFTVNFLGHLAELDYVLPFVFHLLSILPLSLEVCRFDLLHIFE